METYKEQDYITDKKKITEENFLKIREDCVYAEAIAWAEHLTEYYKGKMYYKMDSEMFISCQFFN